MCRPNSGRWQIGSPSYSPYSELEHSMSDSFSEIKRKTLEQRRAILIEQYQAANAQILIGGQYLAGQEKDYTSTVLMELQGSLTPFGRRFAQFVVDSIDVANANN